MPTAFFLPQSLILVPGSRLQLPHQLFAYLFSSLPHRALDTKRDEP